MVCFIADCSFYELIMHPTRAPVSCMNLNILKCMCKLVLVKSTFTLKCNLISIVNNVLLLVTYKFLNIFSSIIHSD